MRAGERAGVRTRGQAGGQHAAWGIGIEQQGGQTRAGKAFSQGQHQRLGPAVIRPGDGDQPTLAHQPRAAQRMQLQRVADAVCRGRRERGVARDDVQERQMRHARVIGKAQPPVGKGRDQPARKAQSQPRHRTGHGQQAAGVLGQIGGHGWGGHQHGVTGQRTPGFEANHLKRLAGFVEQGAGFVFLFGQTGKGGALDVQIARLGPQGGELFGERVGKGAEFGGRCLGRVGRSGCQGAGLAHDADLVAPGGHGTVDQGEFGADVLHGAVGRRVSGRQARQIGCALGTITGQIGQRGVKKDGTQDFQLRLVRPGLATVGPKLGQICGDVGLAALQRVDLGNLFDMGPCQRVDAEFAADGEFGRAGAGEAGGQRHLAALQFGQAHFGTIGLGLDLAGEIGIDHRVEFCRGKARVAAEGGQDDEGIVALDLDGGGQVLHRHACGQVGVAARQVLSGAVHHREGGDIGGFGLHEAFEGLQHRVIARGVKDVRLLRVDPQDGLRAVKRHGRDKARRRAKRGKCCARQKRPEPAVAHHSGQAHQRVGCRGIGRRVAGRGRVGV